MSEFNGEEAANDGRYLGLCLSCSTLGDLISEHCEGPVLCPYACPCLEPERAARVHAKEGNP